MPKKKVKSAQQREIYRLLDIGLDVRSILKRLQESFGDAAIKESMLYKYRKSYEKSSDEFTLDNMPNLGLPDHINLSLLELWGELCQIEANGAPACPLRPDTEEFRLTTGEAGWYGKLWSVVGAMPIEEQISKQDVLLLSILCENRERISIAVGETPNFSDIMAYLSFRPWVGEDKHLDYIRALKAGTIKPINYMEIMAVALAKCSKKDGKFIQEIPRNSGLPMLYTDYPEELFEDEPEGVSWEVSIEVGPFPRPIQYLAWAKLSFFDSQISPILFRDAETSNEVATGDTAPLASDEIRAFWHQIPPFHYDYTKLMSISRLVNLDAGDSFGLSVEESRTDWIFLLRNLPDEPDPTRSQVEKVIRPDLWEN